MAQIFHRSANTLAKLSIIGIVLLATLAFTAAEAWQRSSYSTNQFEDREQPVQFSHKHHAGDDGIDCRYCHTAVEKSWNAGIPPTKTCMNCHTQIWADSPYLEPVRESYRTGQPIKWVKVHDLPDYVYFNHSIHVNKGVGCSTCHGNVAEMPLVYQASSLQMEWCLQCHRNPAPNLREQKDIYVMDWKPGPDQVQKGAKLVQQYHIQKPAQLQACSTCHR